MGPTVPLPSRRKKKQPWREQSLEIKYLTASHWDEICDKGFLFLVFSPDFNPNPDLKKGKITMHPSKN